MPFHDSAFAVIRRGEAVLLVRTKRRWQLPGGAVEPPETPWSAAAREVREETGLSALILGLTGMYRREDGSHAFVFAARVGRNEEPTGPRNEIRKQRWMPVHKAARLLGRGARRRLLDAIARPQLFRSMTAPRFVTDPEAPALHMSAG